MSSRVPHTKPPCPPRLLENVPRWKSTSLSRPKCSATPRPLGPKRNVEWASSISIRAPWRFVTSRISGKRADVAVHRVDALDHHQLLAPHPGHLALEVHRVVVPEEDGLGLGEDGPVDDGGVRVLVEEDRVARPHEGGDEADVGAVAGREDDAGFLALEARELVGELLVDLEGPGQDRGPRGPQAVLLDRLGRRALDLGTVGDPEVVVGREVQEVLPLLGLPVAHADVGGRARFPRASW